MSEVIVNSNVNPLRSGPVVCAVGTDYQIMVPVKKKVLMSVTVGGKEYFNHCGGAKLSDTPVQRFTVPMAELNKAKSYTITYETVFERLAYSCVKSPKKSITYSFKPITKKTGINIYLASDCHGKGKEAVCAASFFGDDLDLLILNGDVSSSSETIPQIMLPYDIAYKVTKGEKPCIITRGNHDLRGKYAEQLTALMPNRNGTAYYTVNLGPMNFLVLDCGEDKPDDHEEYSGTAAFHQMRLCETEFIEDCCKKFKPGKFNYRFVVVHAPFQCAYWPPFNIENDIYTRWCEVISEKYKPNLLLGGHVHKTAVWHRGGEGYDRDLACDTVVGGRPINEPESNFIGTAITLNPGKAEIRFTDKRKNIIGSETVDF